jgi:hypothetical protein
VLRVNEVDSLPLDDIDEIRAQPIAEAFIAHVVSKKWNWRSERGKPCDRKAVVAFGNGITL